MKNAVIYVGLFASAMIFGGCGKKSDSSDTPATPDTKILGQPKVVGDQVRISFSSTIPGSSFSIQEVQGDEEGTWTDADCPGQEMTSTKKTFCHMTALPAPGASMKIRVKATNNGVSDPDYAEVAVDPMNLGGGPTGNNPNGFNQSPQGDGNGFGQSPQGDGPGAPNGDQGQGSLEKPKTVIIPQGDLTAGVWRKRSIRFDFSAQGVPPQASILYLCKIKREKNLSGSNGTQTTLDDGDRFNICDRNNENATGIEFSDLAHGEEVTITVQANIREQQQLSPLASATMSFRVELIQVENTDQLSNPVNGQATLPVSYPGAQSFQCRIVDPKTGQTINQAACQYNNGSVTVPVSNLNQGSYTLHIDAMVNGVPAVHHEQPFIKGGPVVSDLPTRLNVGPFNFIVPQDMHVTEWATNNTQFGGLRFFRVLGPDRDGRRDNPYIDPLYQMIWNDCGEGVIREKINERLSFGRAPNGDWYQYCLRTPLDAEYKLNNDGRLPFNHIEVASNLLPQDRDIAVWHHEPSYYRRIRIGVYQGVEGSMEFAYSNKNSRWNTLCRYSPEQQVFRVQGMPEIFQLNFPAGEIVMLTCRQYVDNQPKMVAAFLFVEGGFKFDFKWQTDPQSGAIYLANADQFFAANYCDTCRIPKAVEVVYTERPNASNFLLFQLAGQVQKTIRFHLERMYQ